MKLLSIIIVNLIFILLYQVNFAQNDSINTSILSDVRGENIFIDSIGQNIPILKFVLIGDSTYNEINEIVIIQNSTNDTIQTLFMENFGESPYRGAKYFQLQDLNFDNYKDLMKLHWWGASGNEYFQIFTYNQHKSKFEFDEFLSSLTSPVVLDSSKELYSFTKLGGGEYLRKYFKYIDGKYIQTKEVLRKADYQKGVIRETVKVRRNNKMILIEDKIVEKF